MALSIQEMNLVHAMINVQDLQLLQITMNIQNHQESDTVTTTTEREEEVDLDFSTSSACSCAVPVRLDESLCSSRSVRFSNVEIREYAVEIGADHGMTRYFPLTLSWQHAPARTVDIEEYEANRGVAGEVPLLSLLERIARIAQVTGTPPALLQEQRRIRLLQEKTITISWR
jgi:hypothetical protein